MTAMQRSGQHFGDDAASTTMHAAHKEPLPTGGPASSFAVHAHAGGFKGGSRAGSLRTGASMDLALLNLASSASADLSYRRAESLLPCGLTQDELFELIGRYADGESSSGQAAARAGGGGGSGKKRSAADVRADIGGGVKVGLYGAGGLGEVAEGNETGSEHQN